ncbi:MAG: Ig-like domain-containing protein [Deltaproteobacteria bacterium]|nr:Ig-like domain-containing protein [Deltaproteobacteria bacterium]
MRLRHTLRDETVRTGSLLAPGRRAMLALSLGVGACFSFDPGGSDSSGCSGTSGELRHGKFDYQCLDEREPACEGWGAPMGIPSPIAVGAAFLIRYEDDDQSSAGLNPQLFVVPASPLRVATAADGALFLLDEGPCSLLAKNAHGTVYNYVHLYGARVAMLELEADWGGWSAEPLVGGIDLEVGQFVDLRVTARGPSGAACAGALSYAWSSSDPAVVALEPQDSSRVVRVVAQSGGTVTLSVSLGTLSASAPITVLDGPPGDAGPEAAQREQPAPGGGP